MYAGANSVGSQLYLRRDLYNIFLKSNTNYIQRQGQPPFPLKKSGFEPDIKYTKTLNIQILIHVVASKIPGIRWYNIQQLLLWIKKVTLTSFVALGKRSEENAQKNGGPTVGFSFMTMLQHAGRLWSRISYQRTCDNTAASPHTLLSWLQLIFNCSLDQNQHWRNSAFVMLLTSLRMQRKSWKGFHKMASRNVSSASTVARRSVHLHKATCFEEKM